MALPEDARVGATARRPKAARRPDSRSSRWRQRRTRLRIARGEMDATLLAAAGLTGSDSIRRAARPAGAPAQRIGIPTERAIRGAAGADDHRLTHRAVTMARLSRRWRRLPQRSRRWLKTPAAGGDPQPDGAKCIGRGRSRAPARPLTVPARRSGKVRRVGPSSSCVPSPAQTKPPNAQAMGPAVAVAPLFTVRLAPPDPTGLNAVMDQRERHTDGGSGPCRRTALRYAVAGERRRGGGGGLRRRSGPDGAACAADGQRWRRPGSTPRRDHLASIPDRDPRVRSMRRGGRQASPEAQAALRAGPSPAPFPARRGLFAALPERRAFPSRRSAGGPRARRRGGARSIAPSPRDHALLELAAKRCQTERDA